LLHGTAELSTPAALLVNAGQQGYARVLYDGVLFDELPPRVPALQPADQLGLLNDAWAFGMSLYAPAGHWLQLAAQLPASADPVVWERLLSLLETLDQRYADGSHRASYRRFALGLVAPLAVRLGAAGDTNEPANIEILRGHLQEVQARFGDADVIAAARRRFAANSGTSAELRTALNIVAATADSKTFDALLLRAQQTSDPLQKLHLYTALTSVADPALAPRMIDVALGDQVPAGTASDLILQIGDAHPDLTWNVVAPRLDDPQLPLTRDERWRVASEIARQSALPERITDLQAYVERSVPESARKPFLGASADIRRNQRIVTRVLPEIDGWVAARRPPRTDAR
jgi:hypothetical protein